MIEFGKTLREAREAKGYSTSQLAEITHILPQIIENLEKEDFARIVAPIYGRGFVKLYCEAVGLEPQPFVTEFMEIFNGNRPPVIRLKAGASESVPVETPAPVMKDEPLAPPATEEPPELQEPAQIVSVGKEPGEGEPVRGIEEPTQDVNLFNFESVPEKQPVRDAPTHLIRDTVPFDASEPEKEETCVPRHHDYRLPGCSMTEVPRRFWRFGVLFGAAALVLALLFFCCRALYRATMEVPVDERGEKVERGEKSERGEKEQQKPRKTSTPRKPISVPPLYID